MEHVKQLPGCAVAAEQHWNRLGDVELEAVLPCGVIQERDSMTVLNEVIGCRQSGQAGTQDEDGL